MGNQCVVICVINLDFLLTTTSDKDTNSDKSISRKGEEHQQEIKKCQPEMCSMLHRRKYI